MSKRKRRRHPEFYLGYGSNLNVIQMQQRCPTAMPVVACNLPDHRLVFSGIATVEHAPGLVAPSALWRVAPRDIVALDRYEGYPRLYSKRFSHATVRGERVKVFYYVLNQPYSESPPSEFYYRTLLEGYRDWHLPVALLKRARNEALESAQAQMNEPARCATCDTVWLRGDMVEVWRGYLECPLCYSQREGRGQHRAYLSKPLSGLEV
jgi:hypothetical protein